MNRALWALASFALLFAAGLVWLRLSMTAPELPAAPELLPADTAFYFETRDPAAWLAGGGMSSIPVLRQALLGLPITALAAGVIAAEPGQATPRALVLAETADPGAIEAAVRTALPASEWQEQQHQKMRARWSTFHRPGYPVLAWYRARGTVALALGEEPLSRLIASKRHGAPSLADRPEFTAVARPDPAAPLLWSDGEALAQLAPALAALPGSTAGAPSWVGQLRARLLELASAQATPAP